MHVHTRLIYWKLKAEPDGRSSYNTLSTDRGGYLEAQVEGVISKSLK